MPSIRLILLGLILIGATGCVVDEGPRGGYDRGGYHEEHHGDHGRWRDRD